MLKTAKSDVICAVALQLVSWSYTLGYHLLATIYCINWYSRTCSQARVWALWLVRFRFEVTSQLNQEQDTNSNPVANAVACT